MRDVVPPLVDFSHSTADFQTLLFPSSYGSSAAAKGDRGGGTAVEQQRILTTASLGRPDLVLEAAATTTTTEGATGLFGVSSSSCLLAPNSPPQQTLSSSAHHHHQQTFFRAQHRQGLERSQTVVEQQQPLQQLLQGEGRHSLRSACQEGGEGGAGRGGLNMSTQQELHQLQQQENHLGIIASNLATQQSLPVGPLSQQQANGNQLGFAPHHQQANSMHGGRHQGNNNNSNMRPPFEDEQRRAYTEQHQAQQQQQQQQHHHQQQQHQQQQLSYGMMFDDMFPVTAATSMNMMGSRAPAAAMGGPNADPRLLEYPQQHFQQAGGLNAIRNYVLDNSSQYQQMDNHMMQYGADPWDSMEMFAPMDAPKDSYYGGHPIMQQRSSLTHEAMMFPRGQMPPSSQTGQGSYLGQFDASRRPPPSRMMPDTRNWLPSLTYDSNGNVPAGALVAPPRSMAPRPSTARSGSGSVAYQPQVSQGRKTSAPSSGRSRDDAISKKPRSSHSPMAGENRLKITFIGIGTPGEAPQHFGTKGYIIPNGLAGMHQVYHQRWRFDTKHVKIDDVICVSWSITNLASGTTSQRTETPREARVRETSGHTICNQLLRQALKSRAAELEATLDSLRDNMTKFSNTENLIKALRPKSCILGLLFFGLLHDTVQQRMRDLLGITTPLHQMASAHLMVGAGGEVEGNGSASSGLDHGGSPGSGGELGSI